MKRLARPLLVLAVLHVLSGSLVENSSTVHFALAYDQRSYEGAAAAAWKTKNGDGESPRSAMEQGHEF